MNSPAISRFAFWSGMVLAVLMIATFGLDLVIMQTTGDVAALFSRRLQKEDLFLKAILYR